MGAAMKRLLESLSPVNRLLAVVLLGQVGWLVADHALRGEPYAPDVVVGGARLFPGLEPSSVHRLSLTGGGRTTELARDGEGWVVANEGRAAADAAFVATALESLQKLEPGAVVAENPARHEAYDVAGDLALEVVATGADGGEIGRFVCGRATPDGRGFYLRYPADSELVMLARPSLRDAFVRGGNAPGAWRDKTLFQDDPRRVRALELVTGSGVTRLERQVPAGSVPSNQDEWRIVAPIDAPAQALPAHSMAGAMSELRADGWAGSDARGDDLGLEPPRVRAVATLDDGSERSLEIGAERGNLLYVRITGQEEVYRVQTFRLFNFLKSAEELRGR